MFLLTASIPKNFLHIYILKVSCYIIPILFSSLKINICGPNLQFYNVLDSMQLGSLGPFLLKNKYFNLLSTFFSPLSCYCSFLYTLSKFLSHRKCDVSHKIVYSICQAFIIRLSLTKWWCNLPSCLCMNMYYVCILTVAVHDWVIDTNESFSWLIILGLFWALQQNYGICITGFYSLRQEQIFRACIQPIKRGNQIISHLWCLFRVV